jgi:heptosyltransferase-2
MRPARPNRRYEAALWLDKRVGPLLCTLLLGVRRLLRRAPPVRDTPISKILVLKFWGMGSIVLASPLLVALRERHPEARIDFATLEENDALLRLVPYVDRRITLGLGKGIPRFLLDTLRLILRVRRERYDLLLDLEFFTRYTAIFSFLANARITRGFSAKGSARGQLHDVEVPFNAYHHVATNFLTLLEANPLRVIPARPGDEQVVLPALAAGEAARARCDAALASQPGYRTGRPTVVINPNTGDMALERRWPPELMAELLRELARSEDVNLVLTGSSGERPFVESVVRLAGIEGRGVVAAGKLDLEAFIALLERAHVVVTNDSGPLHLARAAGAPVVALFGPETPVLYGPLRSRDVQPFRVHYRGLACSPCMFVHDNKVLSCWFAQARCMTEIEPREVLASVRELLEAGHAAAARRVAARP